MIRSLLLVHRRPASKWLTLGRAASSVATREGGCPMTGARSAQQTEVVSADVPQLIKVPAYPLVGSLVPQLSGTPPFSPNAYKFWNGMREKFGEFYSFGLPGLGKGLTGEIFVLHDPKEMMALVRQEGKYPSGTVQTQWALPAMLNKIGTGKMSGIFKRGPEWRIAREFLQTDLLSPKSAKRYVPNILNTVKMSSKAAVHYGDDVKQYLDYASFEMFHTVLFGRPVSVADPTKDRNPEDLLFANTVGKALAMNNQTNSSVSSFLLKKYFGYETELYKTNFDLWEKSMHYAFDRVAEFVKRRKEGRLTSQEADSYINQAMVRQENQGEGGVITPFDAERACAALMTASVDTTSGLMCWYLLHVAMNPAIQDRIRKELATTMVDGNLTPESISASNTPYLHATFRESHRVTSSAPVSMFRTLQEDAEIYGKFISKGSVVCFDGFSKLMDPNVVEDPKAFRPERWLPDAVEARKGTDAEVVDHPLFSGPFSQGARRCPGSRVSTNEAHLLLAQLVLDWDMSVPEYDNWTDVPVGLATVQTPMPFPKVEFKQRF